MADPILKRPALLYSDYSRAEIKQLKQMDPTDDGELSIEDTLTLERDQLDILYDITRQYDFNTSENLFFRTLHGERLSRANFQELGDTGFFHASHQPEDFISPPGDEVEENIMLNTFIRLQGGAATEYTNYIPQLAIDASNVTALRIVEKEGNETILLQNSSGDERTYHDLLRRHYENHEAGLAPSFELFEGHSMTDQLQSAGFTQVGSTPPTYSRTLARAHQRPVRIIAILEGDQLAHLLRETPDHFDDDTLDIHLKHMTEETIRAAFSGEDIISSQTPENIRADFTGIERIPAGISSEAYDMAVFIIERAKSPRLNQEGYEALNRFLDQLSSDDDPNTVMMKYIYAQTP